MHYYDIVDGQVVPRHFVPVASRPGDLRPSTIRDAKKGKWWPSVTTVGNLLEKPALKMWLVEQYLGQAWKTERGNSFEEWLQAVKFNADQAMNAAPDAGSDVHDSLEKWFKGEKVPDAHRAICENVTACVNAHCPGQAWEVEKSFVHPLGFGGKIDLSSPEWVIDYKTKQRADQWKPGKMAYPEHIRQLAAYRRGTQNLMARCANLFVCIETGEVEFIEHTEEALQIEWENFNDLLRIWLRQAQYKPGEPT